MLQQHKQAEKLDCKLWYTVQQFQWLPIGCQNADSLTCGKVSAFGCAHGNAAALPSQSFCRPLFTTSGSPLFHPRMHLTYLTSLHAQYKFLSSCNTGWLLCSAVHSSTATFGVLSGVCQTAVQFDATQLSAVAAMDCCLKQRSACRCICSHACRDEDRFSQGSPAAV